MTVDLTLRLGEIGTVLAEKMPGILDATIVLLESVPPALDAAWLERYEIRHQIGAGGSAEVFLGVIRGADSFLRPVAVKRVRPDLSDPVRAGATLVHEAHLASQLSHPNVVSILDLYRDAKQQPYLVMEYVDGVDLGKFMETGPLPHSVTIFIVRELLSGLGYIHESRNRGREHVGGLVHRDVKPRNVLLSWEGEVKLADFGLAQALEGTADTNAGEGTPGYMSPEQARREELDAQSDLYVAGIVLWELLAHQRLRAGLRGDMAATITFPAVGRPSQHRQDIPVDLEAVAMRLLAYFREERYQTAALAARDLLSCQDAPLDGRAELARLLDERFPRSQGPLARPPEPDPLSIDRRTATNPGSPIDRPTSRTGQKYGQRQAGTLDRARRRRTLASVVLVALLLALVTMIALLAARYGW
jgi:serine/threonine protein kinase